jgi:hypothetical protein
MGEGVSSSIGRRGRIWVNILVDYFVKWVTIMLPNGKEKVHNCVPIMYEKEANFANA